MLVALLLALLLVTITLFGQGFFVKPDVSGVGARSSAHQADPAAICWILAR